MPNERQWIFQWISREAFPILHKYSVWNRIKVLLGDEDQNEIIPFHNTPDLYKDKKIGYAGYIGLH